MVIKLEIGHTILNVFITIDFFLHHVYPLHMLKLYGIKYSLKYKRWELLQVCNPNFCGPF